MNKIKIFRKVVFGLLTLCMMLGVAAPSYAQANEKEDKFTVDVLIISDVKKESLEEKSAIKDMAKYIWNSDKELGITTNISYISADDKKLEAFYDKDSKDKFFKIIDDSKAKDYIFTQNGFYRARQLFLKSKADRKVIVYIANGKANYSYKPKFYVDDYMKNNKMIKENDFNYDDEKISDISQEKRDYLSLLENRFCKNATDIEIYTVAIDSDNLAGDFVEKLATNKVYARDIESNELNKTFKDLALDICDKSEFMKMNLPKDIRLTQWYPEKIIEFPSKRNYDDGEEISLDGMKMKFARVIKVDGHYKKETLNAEYKELKENFKGWKCKLKTKVARYDEKTKGKMEIKFTMKLIDFDKSVK